MDSAAEERLWQHAKQPRAGEVSRRAASCVIRPRLDQKLKPNPIPVWLPVVTAARSVPPTGRSTSIPQSITASVAHV